MEDIISRLYAVMNGAGMEKSALPDVLAVEEKNCEVELLRALRPYLSPARTRKLEEAIRLMGLIKLVPLLREGGDQY